VLEPIVLNNPGEGILLMIVAVFLVFEISDIIEDF
jgi:hypothetical protein